MRELNLPNPKKDEMPEPKVLSMDDYVQFVNENIQYLINREIYRQHKLEERVDVLFKLK